VTGAAFLDRGLLLDLLVDLPLGDGQLVQPLLPGLVGRQLEFRLVEVGLGLALTSGAAGR
jgi:hypothetical protein